MGFRQGGKGSWLLPVRGRRREMAVGRLHWLEPREERGRGPMARQMTDRMREWGSFRERGEF